jgi:hypothetical protein
MNKKIYYATKNHDEKISKNAKIFKFNSYEEMKKWLLEQYDLEDQLNVEIKTMEFDEFWIESYEPIHVGNQYIYAPFNYNQLSIDKFPASGKNCIWITPNHVDVYIAVEKYVDED